MKKRGLFLLAVTILLLAAAAFYAYERRKPNSADARDEALALMPAEASAVLYSDFSQLRQSPFAAKFYSWAPQPQVDADYAEFQRDTGFNYERDLNSLAVAILKRGQATTVFAIADGDFDRNKITAYAARAGTHQNRGGREIYSVSANGSAAKLSFTFLRIDRIAFTNDADLNELLSNPLNGEDAKEWRTRFERLAGSPIFAVIRQDSAAGSKLTLPAPGGFQSPQLATLLSQMQWITLAGKPVGEELRLVSEGECTSEVTIRQMEDVLNGVLLFAQAGLNGPKTRQQLDPQARTAYLEMLKRAEVSRIDRGETKSVRVVFDVTPKFLEAARSAVPLIPATQAAPAAPAKKEPLQQSGSHK
jgi:hypothetical protein